MKKILFLIAFFTTTFLTAQTTGYWAMEFKAKSNSENNISEAFDERFKDVKINKGLVVLERLSTGSQNGMTHRLVWLFTLGVTAIEMDGNNPDKKDAFWAKLDNYIEVWGPTYSGRWLSFQLGDMDKNPTEHIWDIKIKDPSKFKAAHEILVNELKNDFAGRSIGFGTYDIGRPNGATHWMYISGKDGEDHLKLYEKLEKTEEFKKYIQNRGDVIDVKDFELEILKVKK